MDVLVRDLDKYLVKKIDRIAKEKRMSRNDYLKITINNIGMLDKLKNERDRLSLALDKANEAVTLNHKRMESLEQGYEKLFNIIASAASRNPAEVERVFLESNPVKKEVAE